MDTKRTALTVAALGTATGVAGLVLLAAPAGAGEAPPELPPVTAEALVQSVLDAEVPAMAGTVELSNELGLPLPGLPQAESSDGEIARVFADGEGRFRFSMDGRGSSERTVVRDGTTTWVWDSAERVATKMTDHKHVSALDTNRMADPAGAARELVALMREDSTVTVDGTARVADRPVYRLVLTPKPTERTLLSEVRVSVDEQTRLPLRLEVLANGQAEPALSVGFAEFDTGAQDPALFRFTPPQGAKVEERADAPDTDKRGPQLLEQSGMRIVGKGWDTVVVGSLPAGAMEAPVAEEGRSGGNGNAAALLSRLGKPVTGPFGSGHAITTKVGTVLVTDDGRVAVGAVPQQVLVDALAGR